MEKHPNHVSNIPEGFSFLLSMGGCARKVSFGITDLGCHDRPFLVGSKK